MGGALMAEVVMVSVMGVEVMINGLVHVNK